MMTTQTLPPMLTVQASDQDLLAAARQGDAWAYGELVNRSQAGVIAVVYRMCGDATLAEEAAQVAFIRAWEHLAGYRPEQSFRAWLYRIAINAALDELRRSRRLTSLEALTPDLETAGKPGRPDGPAFSAPVPESAPEAVVERRQRAEAVRKAVLALPEINRVALVLREYAGLSYAEIATALNIPLGTVMSRLNSARGQLRQALAGMLEVL